MRAHRGLIEQANGGTLFRDEAGRYGLLDRACPHRGADLSFGRLEPEGLRVRVLLAAIGVLAYWGLTR